MDNSVAGISLDFPIEQRLRNSSQVFLWIYLCGAGIRGHKTRPQDVDELSLVYRLMTAVPKQSY